MDHAGGRPPSVMVVLAHPRPGSLNHSVAATATAVLRRRGFDVHLHDLYAEGFDPVLRAGEAFTSGMRADDVLAASDDPVVGAHRRRLATASALVVVHPNWWGKPPAIMAGWLDRVLVPGVAYRLDEAAGAPVSLLGLREVLVVNTSDTPPGREVEVFGDPLDAIWRRCLPPYLGEPSVHRIVLTVASDAGSGQVARWLAEVTARCESLLRAPAGQPPP